MLDDSNVLKQFGVLEYQAVIDQQLDWLTAEIKSANLPKNLPEISQLYLVTEQRQNLDFDFIKQLVDGRWSSLVGPVNLVSQLVSRQLSKNCLVVFEAGWRDQSQLNRLVRQAKRQRAVVIKMEDARLTRPILVQALLDYQVVGRRLRTDLSSRQDWLRAEAKKLGWRRSVDKNLAKQLALAIVGKTGLFLPSAQADYGAKCFCLALGQLARNLAFTEPIADLMATAGSAWQSHPVEKPFAVFDMVTGLDAPLERQHFIAKNRLLSGKMPAAQLIKLKGDNSIEIMMYGQLLALYTATYLAVLNKKSLHQLMPKE